MFLRQITDTFRVRTDPASSIMKPAHIHITSGPQKRKEKLLRTNCISVATAASAGAGTSAHEAPAVRAARRTKSEGPARAHRSGAGFARGAGRVRTVGDISPLTGDQGFGGRAATPPSFSRWSPMLIGLDAPCRPAAAPLPPGSRRHRAMCAWPRNPSGADILSRRGAFSRHEPVPACGCPRAFRGGAQRPPARRAGCLPPPAGRRPAAGRARTGKGSFWCRRQDD